MLFNKLRHFTIIKSIKMDSRGIVLFLLLFSIGICDCLNPVSISQISPKSESIEELSEKVIVTGSVLSSKIPENVESVNSVHHTDNVSIDPEQNHHTRVERSALPILNDIPSPSKSSLDIDPPPKGLIDTNDGDPAGRYFNYIKPTSTLNDITENAEITKSQRMAKDLEGNSFLLKGGPRSLSSGSPIKPTNVTQISQTATMMPINFDNNNSKVNINNPRQNSNPDIQDIITGIVKLLNGNVNVHANTQGQRRPVASRINNRGPPRISEAQPLPFDFEHQKAPASSMRPPPYTFERPFITGVPIPEQIVPSLQQNYRPGFISQNRLPWHRPRPRPPISGNRRPIPPYKPIVPFQEYHPDDEIQFTTATETEQNDTLDVDPTGPPRDNESNKEKDEGGGNLSSSIPIQSHHDSFNSNIDIPSKKEEFSKKKDTKIKSSEKKPIIPLMHSTEATDDVQTTIVQSTSEVNIVQIIPSTSEDITESIFQSQPVIEPSTEDVVQFITRTMTPQLSYSEDVTPTLESTKQTTSEVVVPTTSQTEIQSTELLNFAETSTSTSSSIISSSSSSSSSSSIEIISSSSNNEVTTSIPPSYHPRPGIVLDDPEFKPGGIARPSTRPIQRPLPTRHHPPPGYGEIFDVTLSAIQGPGGLNSGSLQTINIKPFGGGLFGESGNGDIIISPSGDEGFVSIDGKRTYINLFGESTDAPTNQISATPTLTSSATVPHISSHHRPQSASTSPAIIGTGYAIPETEDDELLRPTKSHNKPIHIQPTQNQAVQSPSPQRPHYRPRTTQPPVRIDTCIVGDDSTCDQAQNERCKTENGVSSCHCRPGYSRRKHREPCRRVVSFFMSLRVDRIYERRIVWDKLLLDQNSEPFGQLSYESVRAIDSAMSMTPFSDEFMEAKVNNIYRGDTSQGGSGVFVNLTLKIEENAETLRPNLRADVQKHLLGVIHRRNNNIGNSVLYVESPSGSVSNLQDIDECQSMNLNDCHQHALCSNTWGSFRCECEKGFRDPWSDQILRAGRECLSCPESHCNNRGTCNYDLDGVQVCSCDGNFYGSQCEIDGEVLGVAIGASVAAVIIIVLTLICLIMWSRKWHREQKNAIGSPVFGYMTTGPVKGIGQSPYQVTLEDRMRWAQIADVMAQANHYAYQAEPIAPPPPTRPSSAMFGYPNLQALNMGTLGGGMSMAGTMQMHGPGTMPPVPLPRRSGRNARSNGMRTLENSSSSEEEDRTDLLGRHFQVPRPKSRSNGSIANQSGIYYDVDYEPSGGELYGGTTTTSISNPIPGPQGIPLSTYTSGRAPSSYYMK